MRYRTTTSIIIGLGAALGLITAQIANAGTIIARQDQIVVTGTVPDRRYIVVDAAGIIRQIFSNTDKAVEPAVVVGSLTGPAAPLTPELRAKYNAVISQLRANKVVSIQAEPGSLIEYPNFTRSQLPDHYMVTPTRVRWDEQAEPYTVSL